MPINTAALRRRLLPALIVGLLAPVAQAQSQADDGQAKTLDQVVVTGVRASHRTALESPVPVDVLTQDDLRAAGAVNGELGQALATLLPSFNFPRQSNSGGSDHVRAAQLRGLSPDQVLVLVNGKRFHTSALVNTDTKIGRGTTPVDFNAIPISAIKRVEVLRDGAGAQYGSDAIAGVVNIILDDAPQGGEVTATGGAYHTHFRPADRDITDGDSGYAAAKWGTRLAGTGFFRFGIEANNHGSTNRAGIDTVPDWLADPRRQTWRYAGGATTPQVTPPHRVTTAGSTAKYRWAAMRRSTGSARIRNAIAWATTISATRTAAPTSPPFIRTATCLNPSAAIAICRLRLACAACSATGTTTAA